MDPVRVRYAVGMDVKPTNPLLQYIPNLKTIDEWNEFTKTEQYRKLMDWRRPVDELKIDPAMKPYVEKMFRKRERFMEIKDYPLYAKLPAQRFWYRATWVFTIIGAGVAFNNVFHIIKNN